MSTESALFQVVHRLEKSLKHKEIALGAFLDIEGAFDNTSFNAMVGAARVVDLRRSVVGGSGPCLRADSYMLFVIAIVWLPGLQEDARRGGVMSPLLWNLLVDELLACINDQGFCAMGYADDIVIIVHGKYTHCQGAHAGSPE
jgi:hypothetical protein